MKKILIVVGFVLLVVLVYLVNEGLFRTIQITERRMPGYRVMGLEHLGPYEKIGGSFRRVHELADQQGVPVKMIGVYFDNPREVAEDSLHSMAGLIVSEADSVKLSKISEFRALTIPAGDAAVSTFETDGMVSMILGAMKSYPKLTEYVTAQNRDMDVNFVYEVYLENQTEYVMQFQE